MHQIFTIDLCIRVVVEYLLPKDENNDWSDIYNLTYVNKYFFKFINDLSVIDHFFNNNYSGENVFGLDGNSTDN